MTNYTRITELSRELNEVIIESTIGICVINGVSLPLVDEQEDYYVVVDDTHGNKSLAHAYKTMPLGNSISVHMFPEGISLEDSYSFRWFYNKNIRPKIEDYQNKITNN